MDWSIQEIAKLTGVTSRTLRHYDEIGLLGARRGANGYRAYDADSLVRLQRILLLRELGLGLPAIAEVLAGSQDDGRALRVHLDALRAEQDRIARQITSVEATLTAREGGEHPMAEEMFDGFDHTAYREEVVSRWGEPAYATGDAWWRAMSEQERTAWKADLARLQQDWTDAAASGVAPDSAPAQDLAARHVAWLAGIPGTPGSGGPPAAYLLGLGEMYVADERFAANYGGVAGATFVRDALRVYTERA